MQPDPQEAGATPFHPGCTAALRSPAQERHRTYLRFRRRLLTPTPIPTTLASPSDAACRAARWPPGHGSLVPQLTTNHPIEALSPDGTACESTISNDEPDTSGTTAWT